MPLTCTKTTFAINETSTHGAATNVIDNYYRPCCRDFERTGRRGRRYHPGARPRLLSELYPAPGTGHVAWCTHFSRSDLCIPVLLQRVEDNGKSNRFQDHRIPCGGIHCRKLFLKSPGYSNRQGNAQKDICSDFILYSIQDARLG